ncbi:MAG: UDP-N-acetylglucosamine--N-acetylmuramyl-(pentapeptide) pyrophosphoryl-undecaprenol N-acetylglucosamine transferase [Candidatus Nealsonbacteria bacterium]|nr:UDP-N-acetylglucosamine--N-acetylmuramyl-(pentapeptide) pyrophosphoryl-undecaprenol N-acetylglucosamine transferase [Candidatus Nealsonbacteria bacterium]
MKILFTGGGTGGHLFPLIAIIRELKEIDSLNLEMSFIGPEDDFSKELFKNEGIYVKRIMTGKIRRQAGLLDYFQNILDMAIRVPIGIIQSFYYIFFLSPDLIFSKGGHGSVPAIIAGKLLQVPIFLHESDVAPGLANKKINKFALEIFSSFPKTEYFPPEKLIFVGNPIRKELLEPPTEGELKRNLSIKSDKPIIFIIGGSQGSERINDLIMQILPQLLDKFEIIHQCGLNNFENIQLQAEFLVSKSMREHYHLFGFMNESQLKSAYIMADIVVSRSGSGSIFEIASFGKPSILIPIPESAQNHQAKNAYAYSDYGAGLVMEEDNLTPHFFLQKLIGLINSPKSMESMKEKAKEFSKPRSARIIAEYIVEFLR